MGSRSKRPTRTRDVDPAPRQRPNGKPTAVPDFEILEMASPEQAQQDAQAFERMLQNVADGVTNPPNEYCAFMANKLRIATQDRENIKARLANAQEQIKNLEKDRDRMSGIADQYGADLREWVKKSWDAHREAARKVAKPAQKPDTVAAAPIVAPPFPVVPEEEPTPAEAQHGPDNSTSPSSGLAPRSNSRQSR